MFYLISVQQLVAHTYMAVASFFDLIALVALCTSHSAFTRVARQLDCCACLPCRLRCKLLERYA